MVARDVAKQLGESRIISIAEAIREPEPIPTGERVGFVFPMYYQVIPPIVQDFVEKLQLDKVHYIFAVITSGAFVGDPLSRLSNCLKNKGTNLDAGFQISLPNNYILAPFGFTVPSKRKQENQLKREKQKIAEIADIIRANRRIGIDKKPFFLFRHIHPRSFMGKAQFDSKINNDAKNFWTTDDCNGCKRCQNVCPVHNIEVVNRPIWHDNCQQCLACLHWCPKQAIQYGKWTVNKKQYTNPSVTIKDISRR
jgi:ferredoxin